MKVNNPSLEKVAFLKEQYPANNLPEIALVGRSNVGKSSFINTMINQKNLARTSSQPGKTRTINFYNIDNKFRFVDLPGYGYAKASKKEIDEWGVAINNYLESRENLREIFLVIDFRHAPTKQDKMMYDYLVYNNYAGIVIATKADKVKKSEVLKNKNTILKELGISDENLYVFSSINKDNKNEIWKRVDSILS